MKGTAANYTRTYLMNIAKIPWSDSPIAQDPAAVPCLPTWIVAKGLLHNIYGCRKEFDTGNRQVGATRLNPSTSESCFHKQITLRSLRGRQDVSP